MGLILHIAVQSRHPDVVANEVHLLLLAHQAGPVLDNRLESVRPQIRFGLSLPELLLGEQIPLLKLHNGLLLRSQVIALDIVVIGLRDEARVEGLLDLPQIAQSRHLVPSRGLLLVALAALASPSSSVGRGTPSFSPDETFAGNTTFRGPRGTPKQCPEEEWGGGGEGRTQLFPSR